MTKTLFPFLRRALSALDTRRPPMPPEWAEWEARRPLRVLGREGWLRWELVDSAPGRRTYRLDIDGETAELEDFGEV